MDKVRHRQQDALQAITASRKEGTATRQDNRTKEEEKAKRMNE